MDKNDIRQKFKAIRKGLTGEMTEAFYNTPEYRKAEKIFCFYSFGSEIDTTELIKRALYDGKNTALPCVREGRSDMVFIAVDSLDGLAKDRYGIPSPEYDENKIVPSDRDTLIIVPGLAFDDDFYRIGYGGGYYDKYLGENTYMSAAGVCFEKQLTQRLPRDEHDIAVDMIATEKGIRRK